VAVQQLLAGVGLGMVPERIEVLVAAGVERVKTVPEIAVLVEMEAPES